MTYILNILFVTLHLLIVVCCSFVRSALGRREGPSPGAGPQGPQAGGRGTWMATGMHGGKSLQTAWVCFKVMGFCRFRNG